MECLLPYLCMVTVPHIMVGLERMLHYRGVGLERFHCTAIHALCTALHTLYIVLCVQYIPTYIPICVYMLTCVTY